MDLSDLRSLGVTGLQHNHGQIDEEPLRELRGARWKQALREMQAQDPIVGATLTAIELLIRQVSWTVMPFDASREAAEDAAFVTENLHGMAATWPLTLAEMLSFVPWGWADLEILYARRGDGRLGWGAWSIRAQESIERWLFDAATGHPTGFVQIAAPAYREVPIPFVLNGARKVIHLQTTSRKGNPEGRSALRSAYRPWYFKKHIENIEGIGIERDLAGLPVAYVPPSLLRSDASAEEKAAVQAIAQLVVNIRRDAQEGIVFPLEYDANGKEKYKLTLLSSGGARQFNTDGVIKRYDARIAMATLADVILIGHEKTGSFALASSKTTLLAVALGAYLDTICAAINQQAIPDLMRLNGRPTDRLPQLAHGDVESVNLGELGTYIGALSGAGAPLFAEDDGLALLNHLLRQAGLPERTSLPAQRPAPPPPADEEENANEDEQNEQGAEETEDDSDG
jgi:hypothetical protein